MLDGIKKGINAYEEFEKTYPILTAGSEFNPFLGFDVVELYENAAKGLRKKGYTGIYVVYLFYKEEDPHRMFVGEVMEIIKK